MRTLRLTATVCLAVAVLVLTLSTALAATAGAGSPVIVATTPGDSKDPVIAYGGGITHVVWVEDNWIMHSYNTGLAWTAPVSIALGAEPSLVVDHAGIPQLAFTELFSSTTNVYHARFISPTWTLPHRVSSGSNNTIAPDIAVAPDNSLTLVWSESQPLTLTKQIEVAESTNGGATWPTAGPVTEARGNAPKIAIGSDGIAHIVWQDDTVTPFHINHVQRSTGTWSVITVVSNQIAPAFTPDLTTMADQAHIVWKQSNAIQYAHGANITFSPPVAISSGSGSAPAISSNSSGALLAAWTAGTNVVARLGGPGGWGNEQMLGSNGSGVSHVALTTGPQGNLYAAFAAGADGSRDIMFNTYTTFAVYLPLIMR